MTPEQAAGLLGGIGLLLLFALAVMWIVLSLLWLFVPFALFGIKKRLDRIGTALETISIRMPGEDTGPDIFRSGRPS